MSDVEQSRFTPQNPHWYADLPARGAPDDDRPAIFGDLNHIDEIYLEISKASGKLRGGAIFFGMLAFGPVFFVIWLVGSDIPGLIQDTFDLIRDDPWMTILLPLYPLMLFGLFAQGIFGFRLDLTTPRDEPVRFNRKRGKVYLSEFKHTWNPFAKWEAIAKEFDWHTLQAEVTKQAGFNGKIYMERYALFLVSVKPGTNEVLDRFQLAGNTPFEGNFPALWAYLKDYMDGGPIVKPDAPLRKQEVRFINSIYEWFPILDFTEATDYGRDFTKHGFVPSALLIFMGVVGLLASPVLFPIAVCHYIAMRVAPAAIWPPAMDVESKSAPLTDEIKHREIAV